VECPLVSIENTVRWAEGGAVSAPLDCDLTSSLRGVIHRWYMFF